MYPSNTTKKGEFHPSKEETLKGEMYPSNYGGCQNYFCSILLKCTLQTLYLKGEFHPSMF